MHDVNSIPHFLHLPHFYGWKNCSKTISAIADNLEQQFALDFSGKNDGVTTDEDIETASQILHGLRQLASIAQKRTNELEKPIRQFNKACLQDFRSKKRSDKAVNS